MKEKRGEDALNPWQAYLPSTEKSVDALETSNRGGKEKRDAMVPFNSQKKKGEFSLIWKKNVANGRIGRKKSQSNLYQESLF